MQNFSVSINERYYLGMNDKFNGSDLPPGVFALIKNGIIDTNNIAKRPGTTGSNVVVASGVFLGGAAFEPNGGSKMIIVCLNGASNAQLYKSTDGINFSAIGTANLTNDAQMNFVQASGKLFGFNGIEVVDVASDGTTVTRNRSGVPKGSFGVWVSNYLFVSGVSATPNRVFWSDLGDPTTFSAPNFVDVSANDGDTISGLNSFYTTPTDGTSVIVAKHGSLHYINGFSGTTFSATTIAGQNTNTFNTGFGCVGHRSMVAAGIYLYYMSFVGGIPMIRKLQRSLYGIILDGGVVSYDMQGTLSALNNTKLSLVTGIYDGKYVYYGMPSLLSTVNDTTLVYYPTIERPSPLGVLRSWVEWTGFSPNSFFFSTVSGSAVLYFGDAGTTGKVFHFDSSVYTDNVTTNVTLTVQTRDFSGHPSRKSKYRYLYFKYGSGGAGTLSVSARVDQQINYTLQDTLSLAGNSPGLGSFILGTSFLGGATVTEAWVPLVSLTGHLFGVEFTESTAHACNIYDMQIYGFLKGFRSS